MQVFPLPLRQEVQVWNSAIGEVVPANLKEKTAPFYQPASQKNWLELFRYLVPKQVELFHMVSLKDYIVPKYKMCIE
jgi:hypothetical protein